MLETLSFEGFVSKIHEVFDRLPDHRRFSPNLRNQLSGSGLGAPGEAWALGRDGKGSRLEIVRRDPVGSQSHPVKVGTSRKRVLRSARATDATKLEIARV